MNKRKSLELPVASCCKIKNLVGHLLLNQSIFSLNIPYKTYNMTIISRLLTLSS